MPNGSNGNGALWWKVLTSVIGGLFSVLTAVLLLWLNWLGQQRVEDRNLMRGEIQRCYELLSGPLDKLEKNAGERDKWERKAEQYFAEASAQRAGMVKTLETLGEAGRQMSTRVDSIVANLAEHDRRAASVSVELLKFMDRSGEGK